MRAPGSKLVIYLTLPLLGLALTWYGFRAEQKIGEDWQSIGMALVGIILIPISAVYAILALLHSIGRLRLLSGHNVLARWHVPASAWQRSQDLDPQWFAQSGLVNDLKVAKSLIDRGIDVIVGTKSLLVGDTYFPLRQMGIPQLYGVRLIEDSDPGCIEFQILYRGRYGPIVRMALRVPFTAESRPQAVQVHEYFAQRYVPKPSLARRRPRRTIAVSLIVSALAAAAAAWGFGEFNAGRTTEVVPLIAALVGIIVAPVGLVFALVTFLLAWRRRLGVR